MGLPLRLPLLLQAQQLGLQQRVVVRDLLLVQLALLLVLVPWGQRWVGPAGRWRDYPGLNGKAWWGVDLGCNLTIGAPGESGTRGESDREQLQSRKFSVGEKKTGQILEMPRETLEEIFHESIQIKIPRCHQLSNEMKSKLQIEK